MKKKVKFSKRTTALIVAAVLLLAGGGVAGTRAALNIQSELYRAHFYLNHLQVHLIENDHDVCVHAQHENNLDGFDKATGELATELGYVHPYEGEETLGTVDPGKIYPEKIQAKNGSNIDEFVRLTVRKYWMEEKKDAEGNTVVDDEGNPVMVKSSKLSPDRIKLMYGKNKDPYNRSAWIENESEGTAESKTYYYKTDLSNGETSAPLFDQLMIDATVADLGKVTEDKIETQDGNTKKTVYTYTYQYDGCTFFIEADVQAIQTHNANEAIRSQWGVDDVTATYSDPEGKGNGSGTLSVK